MRNQKRKSQNFFFPEKKPKRRKTFLRNLTNEKKNSFLPSFLPSSLVLPFGGLVQFLSELEAMNLDPKDVRDILDHDEDDMPDIMVSHSLLSSLVSV